MAYGVQQLISTDLINCHVLSTQVDAQRLRQAERDPAGLAVDHQRGDPGAPQLISYLQRPADRVRTMRSAAVGDEHQQWAAARVADPLQP